jgi:hypothetical protein
MAVNLSGITYYKLDSLLHGYEGDVTKNCGLRGEEIDGNFNFLRGNDIKEIFFNDEGNLIVKKHNNDEIIAVPSYNGIYDFKFNADDGMLIVTTPNSEEIVLSGFTSVIYHDNTLSGNGDKETPLSISSISKTGRFLPVIRLVNYSIDEVLPEVNNLHDRYVTKECVMITDENDVIVDSIVKYYVNDWNGNEWDRHELNEGESVVIIENEDGNTHEWMLCDGILVDTVPDINTPISNVRDELILLVNDEKKRAIDAESSINETLNSEIENLLSRVNDMELENGNNYDNLNERITEETNRSVSVENELRQNIECEIERAATKENEIITSFNILENYLENKNNELDNKIDNLNNRLTGEINVSNDFKQNIEVKINDEIERAVESEHLLDKKIDDEINRATDYENLINTKIETEIVRATNKEVEIINLVHALDNSFSDKECELNNRIICVNKRVTDETSRAVETEKDLQEQISKEVNKRNEDISNANAKIEEIKSRLFTEISDSLNSNERLNKKIETLITTEEIIRKNSDDALLSKITINENKINDNKVYSNGKSIIVTGPSSNGTNIDVNIDNNTIISNNGVLTVNDNALTQYIGKDAINITSEENGYKNVYLRINDNDKILTNNSAGLNANLSLKWVHADAETNTKDEIQLIGKDNIVISRIDVTDFIKDGILESVSLDTVDKDNPKLVFIFSSIDGKETVELPVKDIVKLYYAGNGLELIENTFSVKIDGQSEYLYLSNNGIKVYGINAAIEKTKVEVNETFNNYKSEINLAITNLNSLINTLNGTLDKTIEELNKTKIELSETKVKLSNTEKELNNLKTAAITDVVGTANEIKVTKVQNTATIGFADDAYFAAG